MTPTSLDLWLMAAALGVLFLCGFYVGLYHRYAKNKCGKAVDDLLIRVDTLWPE